MTSRASTIGALKPNTPLSDLASLLSEATTASTRESVSQQVSLLEAQSASRGLSTNELEILVSLCLSPHIASATALKLVRCAVPRRGARLRAVSVRAVLCSLGGAPPIGDGVTQEKRRVEVDVKVQVGDLPPTSFEPDHRLPDDVFFCSSPSGCATAAASMHAGASSHPSQPTHCV